MGGLQPTRSAVAPVLYFSLLRRRIEYNLHEFYTSVATEAKTETQSLEHRDYLRDAQENPLHAGLYQEVHDQPLQQLPEALEARMVGRVGREGTRADGLQLDGPAHRLLDGCARGRAAVRGQGHQGQRRCAQARVQRQGRTERVARVDPLRGA